MLKGSASKWQFNCQSISSEERSLFHAITEALESNLNEQLCVKLGKFFAEHKHEDSTTVESKFQALAVLVNKMICVTFLSKSLVGKKLFGDQNTVGTDCIYLFHQNDRYACDDATVQQILDESIEEYRLILVCEEPIDEPNKSCELRHNQDISRLIIDESTLKRKQEGQTKRIRLSEDVRQPTVNLNENNIQYAGRINIATGAQMNQQTYDELRANFNPQ